MINFVGAKPVPYGLIDSKNDLRYDVDALEKGLSDKTKMIIINSPGNPTGCILSEEELQKIANIANERDLWVLSDEIYNSILYDDIFESITQFDGMKERTIILDGLSKKYSMHGYRFGYGVVPDDLIEYMTKLATNFHSCVPAFIQRGAVEAINGKESNEQVEIMVKDYAGRRDLMVDLLNDIEGITCHKPKGSFYVFSNFTDFCNIKNINSDALQTGLLYKAGVAILKRSYFGKPQENETDDYFRLCFAVSEEKIIEGIGRMKKYMEKLSYI